MHVFLDKFHQGEKYTAQIASHQVELIKEEIFNDQKHWFIISLQTGKLNLDRGSGSGRNNERENLLQKKYNFCGGTNHSEENYFQRIIKYKEKYCADSDSDRKGTERTPCKCFRCGSVDHIIDKCPNSPEIPKNYKRPSVSMKGLIMHRKNNMRTVILIMIKRSVHLWHICQVLTKFLVDILVTVRNWPIRF